MSHIRKRRAAKAAVAPAASPSSKRETRLPLPVADGVAELQPARLSIRPAAHTDAAPLCFFFDAVLRRDYFIRRGQLAEILTGRHHRVLLAELDGVLVGVAILTRNTRLVNVLIHPAYRGLQIGRRLVEASGATEVLAKIDMTAGDPRPFYRRLGFASTGEFNSKGNIERMERPRAAAGGTYEKAKSRDEWRTGKRSARSAWNRRAGHNPGTAA